MSRKRKRQDNLEFISLEREQDKGQTFKTDFPIWAGEKPKLKTPVLALHEEIIDFARFIEQQEGESNIRLGVAKEVEDLITKNFHGAQVEIFGSTATGLCVPTSDIDMVVHFNSKQSIKMAMKRLGIILRRHPNVMRLNIIDKARVPIIKFKHKQCNLGVDLAFENDSGLRTAAMVNSFLEDEPQLRPLILILKQYLIQRDLNETYQGGIGSYMLVLMVRIVYRMVRSRMKKAKCRSNAPLNLGSLLIEFFGFYGRYLNVVLTGCRMSDDGPDFYNKQARDWLSDQELNHISIENPDLADHDVGKNSYRFDEFRHAVDFTLQVIRKSIQSSKTQSIDERHWFLRSIILEDTPLKLRKEELDNILEAKRTRSDSIDESAFNPPIEVPVNSNVIQFGNDVSDDDESEEQIAFVNDAEDIEMPSLSESHWLSNEQTEPHPKSKEITNLLSSWREERKKMPKVTATLN